MDIGTPELIGIGTAVITTATAIIKNSEISESIVRFLVKKLNKVEIIDFDDLKRHDYILKLTQLANTNYYELPVEIANKQKEALFFRYVKIVANVSLDSSKLYLDNAHLKLDEQGLKAFVLSTLTTQFNEYDKQLGAMLLEYNNDKVAVEAIIQKIGRWRIVETKLLVDNVAAVISSGKMSSVPYKFDTLFSLFSLGIDMMLLNGVESFNRLNGELDNFLIIKS